MPQDQTTTELIEYYSPGLLIKQYKDKPQAVAIVQAIVEPILMPQDGSSVVDNEGDDVTDNENNQVILSDFDTAPIIPIAIQDAYDINTALGAQLDAVAKYLGISRNGYDFSGAVTLNDIQFSQLIKIVTARNVAKSDLQSIQAFLATFFSGILYITDHKQMRISYLYTPPIGSNIVAEFFIRLGLLPRPLGVLMDLIYSGSSDNFYTFRGYLEPASKGRPIGSYTKSYSGRRLSYTNLLTP